MHQHSVSTDHHLGFLKKHLAYIEKMTAKGGPEPHEYASFNRWLMKVAEAYRSGQLTEEGLSVLREAFGEALSTKTLQGFSFEKPHGYTGDYEIIDRMYTNYVTNDPHLQNWDLFFQTQGAPTAVRNRKAYFLKLVEALKATFPNKTSLPVLNVASGPARDIFEFFRDNNDVHAVSFECVDNDPEAIEYAKTLCTSYLDRITFQEANALRFKSDTSYQLVWSAGLFDYLGDKGFRFLLTRLLDMLRDDGELVIGNFSPYNSTRNYMEIIGDWYLYHRTAEDLIALAQECGVPSKNIRVGREPKSINLFLHIKRGPHFLDLEDTHTQ